jgi:type-F conjugative transfer system pilin assembly protein TrbC
MRITTTAILILLSGSAVACTIQDAVEGARANAGKYYTDAQRIPESVATGAAQAAAAKQVADTVNTKEFQDKIQKERDRLQREVFGVGTVPKPGPYYYTDSRRTVAGQAPHLASDARIYLFISSSMPLSTLRNYARDIDRLQDPHISMVMRGFIGGIRDATASMEFLMQIRLKDLGCNGLGCATFGTPVDFDPNLYRRFRPDVVPALIYVRGVTPVDPDVSEGSPENVPPPSSWTMIYGDASLAYLFGQVAGTVKSPSLAAMARYLEQ